MNKIAENNRIWILTGFGNALLIIIFWILMLFVMEGIFSYSMAPLITPSLIVISIILFFAPSSYIGITRQPKAGILNFNIGDSMANCFISFIIFFVLIAFPIRYH